MMHTAVFGVAALVGIAIAYGFTKLLPGNASYTEILLPLTVFAGVAAAMSSSVLLQRFGWWPRYHSIVKTGLARGATVVGWAHSLFGFYFMAGVWFDSLLDEEASSSFHWSNVLTMLYISAASLIALPATLVTGCLGGIYADMKS